MSVEFSERKFNYLFDWFDSNGDGHLTREDFEQGAEVWGRLVLERAQHHRDAIVTAFLRWWEVLLMAAEAGSGTSVSREHFHAAMRSHVTQDEHFEATILGIIDALMNALDDGDGKLSHDEYVAMYDGIGVPPEVTTVAFGKMDRDGDGVITRDEFRVAIDEFFRSADPEAPGHWLLGTPHDPAASQ